MSTSVATGRRALYSEPVIRTVVVVDAIVNILAAAVLFAGATAWKSAFGLETSIPVVVLAVVFLVNGIECWITGRRDTMTSTSLWVLAGVDVAFALFALVVAVTDPTGAEVWARWAMAAIGDAALVVGAIKAYGAHRLAREEAHRA